MRFAAFTRIPSVTVLLLAIARASETESLDEAKDILKCYVAAQLYEQTAGLCTPDTYHTFGKAADDWIHKLFEYDSSLVPVNDTVYSLGEPVKNPYVNAALAYGSLYAALDCETDDKFEERLVALCAVMKPQGLFYFYAEYQDIPIMLLAKGDWTVRSSLIKALCNHVTNTTQNNKLFYPQIAYVLALQYIKNGKQDSWDALVLWTSANKEAVITLGLVHKVLTALNTKVLHVLPLNEGNFMDIECDAPEMERLRRVVKAIASFAPAMVIRDACNLKLCDPLLKEILAELKADKAANLEAKQTASRLSEGHCVQMSAAPFT